MAVVLNSVDDKDATADLRSKKYAWMIVGTTTCLGTVSLALRLIAFINFCAWLGLFFFFNAPVEYCKSKDILSSSAMSLKKLADGSLLNT